MKPKVCPVVLLILTNECVRNILRLNRATATARLEEVSVVQKPELNPRQHEACDFWNVCAGGEYAFIFSHLQQMSHAARRLTRRAAGLAAGFAPSHAPSESRQLPGFGSGLLPASWSLG